MMKNQQEWVKNITPTGMKVKVKRMTDHPACTMKGFTVGKKGLSLLSFASLILIFFGMGTAGCDKETSQSSIADDKLVTIYVELLGTRKTPLPIGVDSTLATDSVLMKYGISRQEFLESIHARSTRPESWKAFYEQVVRTLEEKQQETVRKTDSVRATIGARPEPSSK